MSLTHIRNFIDSLPLGVRTASLAVILDGVRHSAQEYLCVVDTQGRPLGLLKLSHLFRQCVGFGGWPDYGVNAVPGGERFRWSNCRLSRRGFWPNP